jgi:hypothetical protein
MVILNGFPHHNDSQLLVDIASLLSPWQVVVLLVNALLDGISGLIVPLVGASFCAKFSVRPMMVCN